LSSAPIRLNAATTSSFARVALAHVTREYPNKLDHVLTRRSDLKTPRELHPAFYGSFDWHSCVHGYWLLATLLRLAPDIQEAERIEALFDEHLTPAKVKRELKYLSRPSARTFERPYGWAWLLMLAAELARHGTKQARRWSAALAPLAEAFAERFLAFLPKATYPTRVGTHFNSAFAITLALEYADVATHKKLRSALVGKAREWYLNDRDCQVWEPGGDDFLSSTLMEAVCMQRVLTSAEFAPWLEEFLPRVDQREPETLFVPATISDRSDGKIAHLDGLNLSRAWCWRSLATTWPATDPRHRVAMEAVAAHLGASLPHVTGDYMGEHWLATFALLALL
jgi:TorA maturation chaperone TorD